MSRTRHKIPENLNPEGDKCYPLFVPDDPEWIRYLIRAVRTLTFDRHWERDENDGADVLSIREQWNTRTYLPLIDALQNDDNCDCDDEDTSNCITLPTSSETFLFEPNNPFDGSDQRFTPIQARWRRWETLSNSDDIPEWAQQAYDAIGDNIGYFPNDVMVSYSDQGIFRESNFENFFDFLSNYTLFPFPVVKWKANGTGQFEIEFVQVPLGGSILLLWDITLDYDQILEILSGEAASEADNWRLFEINRDVASIPPELLVSFIQEIDFVEDGEHIIQAIFTPRVNDEIPFFFPFGGIREIEVCGNLTLVGWQTGEIINQQNYGLQQHNLKGVIGLSTSDDFYDALIRYETEKANRWLFASDTDNILSDVEVDKTTGEVTIKSVQSSSSSGVDASTNQRNNGGAYFQAVKLKKVLDDIDDYNSAPQNYSIGVIQGLTAVFVNAVDASRAVWDGFVSGYVGFLNTPETPVSLDVDLLTEKIYCKGFDAGLIEYLTENHSEDELSQVLEMRQAIPQQTINQWYVEGRANPLDDYLGYECSQLPTLQLTYTAENFINQEQLALSISGWSFASDRRVQIVTSGFFYDTTDAGNYCDLLYYKASGSPNALAASWALARIYADLTHQLNLPASPLPAFNADGTYSYIKTIPAEDYGSIQLQQNHSNQDGWRANAAGQITVKVTDLGAI